MFTPSAVRFTNTVAEQACVDYPVVSDLCADEIEQRIIRAYVQLVFQPLDANNSRSVVAMRLGSLEVRLTELHPTDTNNDLPPFWTEVFDWPHQASIDSVGSHEFDEDELAAVVDMIVSAGHGAALRDVSPPH